MRLQTQIDPTDQCMRRQSRKGTQLELIVAARATSGLAHSTRCKHANASQYIKRMRKLAGSSADTADSRLRVKQGLVLPFQLFQLCLFLNCTRPKLENSDRKQGKTNQSEPR